MDKELKRTIILDNYNNPNNRIRKENDKEYINDRNL